MTEELVGTDQEERTPVDWDEMDRLSAEKQAESMEKTSEAIGAVMLDTSGMDRLDAITDEEWALAQAVDDAVNQAALEEPNAAA